jgi:hypothetical protein
MVLHAVILSCEINSSETGYLWQSETSPDGIQAKAASRELSR